MKIAKYCLILVAFAVVGCVGVPVTYDDQAPRVEKRELFYEPSELENEVVGEGDILLYTRLLEETFVSSGVVYEVGPDPLEIACDPSFGGRMGRFHERLPVGTYESPASISVDGNRLDLILFYETWNSIGNQVSKRYMAVNENGALIEDMYGYGDDGNMQTPMMKHGTCAFANPENFARRELKEEGSRALLDELAIVYRGMDGAVISLEEQSLKTGRAVETHRYAWAGRPLTVEIGGARLLITDANQRQLRVERL